MFDLNEARSKGLADKKIAEFLADKHKFDIAAARAKGLSDTKVAEFLAARPTAEPTGLIDRTIDAGKKLVSNMLNPFGGEGTTPQQRATPPDPLAVGSREGLIEGRGPVTLREDAQRKAGVDAFTTPGDEALTGMPSTQGLFKRESERAKLDATRNANIEALRKEAERTRQLEGPDAEQFAREEYERRFKAGDSKGLKPAEADWSTTFGLGATRAGRGLARGFYGTLEAFGDMLGNTEFSGYAAEDATSQETAMARAIRAAAGTVPEEGFKSIVADAVPTVVSQGVPIAAAALTAVVTRNPAAVQPFLNAAVLTPMGVQKFGENYRDAKAQGLATEDRVSYALGGALAEVVPERLSLGVLMDVLTKPLAKGGKAAAQQSVARELAERFLKAQGTELVTEQITTVADFILEQHYLEPDLSLKELQERMVRTALVTPVATTALLGAGAAGSVAGNMLRNGVTPQQRALRELQDTVGEGRLDRGGARVAADLLAPGNAQYRERQRPQALDTQALGARAGLQLSMPVPAAARPAAPATQSAAVARPQPQGEALPAELLEGDEEAALLQAEILRAEQQAAPDASAPEQAAPQAPAPSDAAEDLRPRFTHVPGRTGTAGTERGLEIPFQYALVEADAIQTSQRDDLSPNPAYPQALQPRDRTRAGSEIQIARMAADIKPRRLGEAPMASEGAPVVGPDGAVESGNGRTIALRRAYAADKAKAYYDWLEENAGYFGFDPVMVARMKAPMLVRVRTAPVDRLEFVRQANESALLVMSPVEQARADAARIDSMDDLTPAEDGDFTSSRAFIRRFVGRLPATEQAGLVDAAGRLSQSGHARIRNAILAKAYGDSPVLARLVESMDDNLRNVGKALMTVAPAVAKARADIAEGALFDVDLTPDLIAAVETLSRLKEEGRPITEALAQMGMLDDGLSAEARELLAFLADNVRRPRKIAEFILRYTEALRAAGNPNQGSLLGETQAPTKAELLAAARGQVNEAATEQQPAAQPAASEQSAEPATRPGEPGAEGRGEPAGPLDHRRRTQGDEGKRRRQVAPPAQPQDETPADAGVSVSGAAAFVPAPDGSIDFGEITPEMARAMRRQAGKIRLQQGVQNADGTGWGLAHIEARHGREIRATGFASVEQFVKDAVARIDAVWQPGKTAQLVAVQAGRKGKVVFLELQAALDDAGDYYHVNRAFPATDAYVARKERRENWKRLWSRYPVSADASGASGFADQSPDAGETAPTVSPHSVASLMQQDGLDNSPLLQPYTNEDIAQQEAGQRERAETAARAEREAEQRAQANAERDGFTLTGSDRPADVAVVRGQQDIFGAPQATNGAAPLAEPAAGYTAEERGARARKNDAYTRDLFGASIPEVGVPVSAPTRVPDTPLVPPGILGGETLRAAAQVAGAKFAVEAGPRVTGILKTAFPRIENARQAAHTLAGLRKSTAERFQVLVLDAEDRPISVLNLFAGAVAQASVHPEVVVKAVYETPGAAKIWYAHNHPSGKAEPSNADAVLTRKLSEAFGPGTGIEVAGHVVLAGTRATEMDAEGFEVGRAFGIPAGARTHAVKITERRFAKVGTLGDEIDSPRLARESIPQIAEGKTGVVFLSTQHAPVAFMPMSIEQMTTLRDGKGARLLFGAAARSNASAAILHFTDGEQAADVRVAASNIYEALNPRDIRVLDALHGATSLAERNELMGTGRGFLSRSAQASGSIGDLRIDMEDLEAVAERHRRTFPAFPVEVVRNEDALPEALRQQIADMDAYGDTAGVFWDGTIYLLRSGIEDVAHAERAVVHEATHGGLSAMFGPELDTVMLDIWQSSVKVQLRSGRLRRRYGYSHVRATEEALADLGGEMVKVSGFKKLVAFIRDFFRARGWVSTWSDNDVAYLVQKARAYGKKPRETTVSRASEQVRTSRSQSAAKDQRTGGTSIGAKRTSDALVMRDGSAIMEVAVIDPTQIKSAIGNRGSFDPDNPDIRLSRASQQPDPAPPAAPEPAQPKRPGAIVRGLGRIAQAAGAAVGAIDAPVDAALRAAFRYSGADAVVRTAGKAAGAALDRVTPEVVKAGVISDYGLNEAAIDRRDQMFAHMRRELRKAGDTIGLLQNLTLDERKVAYNWMTDKDYGGNFDALPKASKKLLNDIRKQIDELSKEAVRLGQLSAEAYERNKMAYLHRSYRKYDLAQTEAERAGNMRSVAIRGEQYRGRGMSREVPMSHIQNGAPEWWNRKLKAGAADKQLKGEKFIRLERRANRGEGVEALPGVEKTGQQGRLLAVQYWPAGLPRPAKYQEWHEAGTWEVRNTRGNQLIMWRDFTKEERQRLGEIEDAPYAVAKTLHQMIHDIEVGRYLEYLANNFAMPEEKLSLDARLAEAKEGLHRAFGKDEWVLVPETKILGTQTLKYGKLAGLYVPGPIWNDIRQIISNKSFMPNWYASILRMWKVSKTALSPTVHTNNIMSNIVMADWHDVRALHIRKAIDVYLDPGKEEHAALLRTFEESGGMTGMWALNELQREQLEPIIEQLRQEAAPAAEMQNMVGVLSAISLIGRRRFRDAYAAAAESLPGKAAKRTSRAMIDLYQSEDQLFRLAAFIKAKEEGRTDFEAGRAAKNSFLNYQINAPWIQAMRQTAFPFISFPYRAVPMVLETTRDRPWKLAKLALYASALNVLGHMLSGGDEEKERAPLPEEKAGRMFFGVPKMLRMPWNDASDSPVFLDVRRWVPIGDFFDTGATHAALPLLPFMIPGGPLAVLAELGFNKSQFTGQPIVLETDTSPEAAMKVFDHLYKAFAPNIPGLPGTYATTAIVNAGKGKTDAFGREQSMPMALASGFGIKLGAYPIDVLKQQALARHNGRMFEIHRQESAADREVARQGITIGEWVERRKRLNEKKAKEAEAFSEKL